MPIFLIILYICKVEIAKQCTFVKCLLSSVAVVASVAVDFLRVKSQKKIFIYIFINKLLFLLFTPKRTATSATCNA